MELFLGGEKTERNEGGFGRIYKGKGYRKLWDQWAAIVVRGVLAVVVVVVVMAMVAARWLAGCTNGRRQGGGERGEINGSSQPQARTLRTSPRGTGKAQTTRHNTTRSK